MSSLQKITASARPLRRWALVAPALAGKSTLAMQMAAPIAVVDSDHRVSDVAPLAKDPDNVFVVAVDCTAMDDVRKIGDQIKAAVRESIAAKNPVKTLVIDSLTAIIDPLTSGAMLSNEAGENRNAGSAFLEKALAMRYLQDAVSQFGTDVLWIWHVEQGSFGGKETERQSLSGTERERLKRNLNAIVEIISDANGRRGVRVENLRPKAGMPAEITLWDDSGAWREMPERIDEFLYPTAKKLPGIDFTTVAGALDYALSINAYPDRDAAKKAYNDVKTVAQPTTPDEMFTAWRQHLAANPSIRAAA